MTSARIRRMNGTSRSNMGLAQVVAPNDDGEWVEIQDRLPMEKALLQAYEVNLTQAKNTPYMVYPLSGMVGCCGETEGARMILEGEPYDGSAIDHATQEVLKYLTLKHGTKLNYTPQALDVQECMEGWAKAKERTSSAMSNGTHFGHWKAGHLDEKIATVHTSFAIYRI